MPRHHLACKCGHAPSEHHFFMGELRKCQACDFCEKYLYGGHSTDPRKVPVVRGRSLEDKYPEKGNK